MNKIYILAISILLYACGTPKMVLQQNQDAFDFANEENYALALENSEAVIDFYQSKGKLAPDSTYTLAGRSAISLGKYNEAINYLEKAIKKGDTQVLTWFDLAKAYRGINNLSKEIDQLKLTLDSFPSSAYTYPIQAQLLNAYNESENWEKADLLWKQMNDKKMQDSSVLEPYINVLMKLNQLDQAYKYSKNLLVLDGKNTTALLNIGSHFYNMAENRYNQEMAIYSKKKTRRQYAYLLEQLKIATKDYKTARNYFLKLYKELPNKEYAAYLSNIYARLNNEKMASYYRLRSTE